MAKVGNIGFQFDKVLGSIGKEEERVRAKLRSAMVRITEHAATRSVANAPIKSGALRAEIVPKPVTVSKNEVRGGVRTVNIPYALRQHEELTPAGPNQLGVISAAQPGTPEGGVGGKYIERVVKYHTVNYLGFIKSSLNEDEVGNITSNLKTS